MGGPNEAMKFGTMLHIQSYKKVVSQELGVMMTYKVKRHLS